MELPDRNFLSISKRILVYCLLIFTIVSVVTGIWLSYIYVKNFYLKNQNLLSEREWQEVMNTLPILNEGINFYYLKTISVTPYGKESFEVVEYQSNNNGKFSTSTLYTFDAYAPNVKVGRFGNNSVVSLRNDGSIIFFSSEKQIEDEQFVLYEDVSEEVIEGLGWPLIFSANQELLYLSGLGITDYFFVNKYDFSSGNKKTYKVATPKDVHANYFTPVYYDSRNERLLIVEMSNGLPSSFSFHVYDFVTDELSRLLFYDSNGNSIDTAAVYYPHIIAENGIFVFSESESKYGNLVGFRVVNFGDLKQASYRARTLPTCEAKNKLILSPDGRRVLCESVDLKDGKGYRSPYNALYERKIIDLLTEEVLTIDRYVSKKYNYFEPLKFNLNMSTYFYAFGLDSYLVEKGSFSIAWLNDNRFLITEANNNGRQLFVDDLRGEKILIDSAADKYQYVGSYNYVLQNQ